MKKIFIIVSLAIAALAMQSCASIVTKSNYPVTFASDPSNASVKITDNRGMTVFSGTTPSTIVLRASSGFFTKASYNVEYTKSGFQKLIIPLDARIDGWYFGNILLGGVIGMLVVDPATGAMWKLDEYVFVELAPEYVSDNTFHIMDINDISEAEKEKLIPLQ